MISGSGRIFYVAKPNSDRFEVFDVVLITGVQKEGGCQAVSEYPGIGASLLVVVPYALSIDPVASTGSILIFL